MDKRSFSELIASATQELGAEVVAGCMSRSLLFIAHSSMNDYEFSCDLGVVSVERSIIPESHKH